MVSKKEVASANTEPPKKVYGVEVTLRDTTIDGYNYFDDGQIKGFFLIDKFSPTKIAFYLENKTDQAIIIDWNKVSYIDKNRISQRIIHQGVKYSQRNENMRNTVIPPRSKFEDIIVPVNKIYYKETPALLLGLPNNHLIYGWQVLPLFDAESMAAGSRNEQFSLYVPLIIGEEKKDYTFTFDVKPILRE